MPIYEYRCEACGHEHEAIRKFSDPTLKDCPSCGKPALKKLVSAAGFHLKGTGWYVTDFRDSDKKKAKAAEAKPDPEKKEKKASEKKASSSTGSND